MLERWHHAPTWVLSAVMGGFFGLFMGVFFLAQGGPWLAALVGAVVTGLLFGAAMGPYAARSRRQAQNAVGDAVELRSAARSLRKGAGAPRDEAERQARWQLARHWLAVLEGQRVWGTAVFVGVSVVAAWLALTQSPWWWLEVVFFAVVILLTWAQRRRLRRIVASED